MKSTEQYEKEFNDNPRGSIVSWIKWIIGLSLTIGATMWIIGIITTPVKTAGDIIKKTLNADNVIQNYEWFKSQVQDYESINMKIKNAESAVNRFVKDAGDRKSWTFEDKNEHSRLTSILDGLKYQRSDIATKYNARTQMYNREIFKTNDLPQALTP